MMIDKPRPRLDAPSEGSFDEPAFRRIAFALAATLPAALALSAFMIGMIGTPAAQAADESWNPFRRSDGPSDRRPEPAASQPPVYSVPDQGGVGWEQPTAPPQERRYLPPPRPGTPVFSNDTAVRSQDLAPLVPSSPETFSAVSSDSLWQGMQAETFRRHLSNMKLPIRSWSLRPLWLRILTSEQPEADIAFTEARGEALLRAGALREALDTVNRSGPTGSMTLRLVGARAKIALGDIEGGCSAIKAAAAETPNLTAPVRDVVILYAGYCAARSGQPSGASLAAQLARNAGIDQPTTIQILDRVGSGTLGGAPGSDALSILDVRLLQLLPNALSTAERSRLSRPAAVALAIDESAEPGVRIAAAEIAAGAGAIGVDDLNAAYASVEKLRVGDPETEESRRGRLWQDIVQDRTIYQRTRDIRTFLDAAKTAGHYEAALRLTATVLPQIKPVPEIGWFSETAIEISIASGRLDIARNWIAFASRQDGRTAASLSHWAALVDIADSQLPGSERGRDLDALERAALAGQIEPHDLHRLTTVLDALNYNVPVRLWDAANRTPQPTDGHLPQTGVLRELADASKAGPSARTVLLTLQTLGENGPTGAHMLALADGIRALKRSGFEADARRMAVEAVFPLWPRAGHTP